MRFLKSTTILGPEPAVESHGRVVGHALIVMNPDYQTNARYAGARFDEEQVIVTSLKSREDRLYADDVSLVVTHRSLIVDEKVLVRMWVLERLPSSTLFPGT